MSRTTHAARAALEALLQPEVDAIEMPTPAALMEAVRRVERAQERIEAALQMLCDNRATDAVTATNTARADLVHVAALLWSGSAARG